MARPEISKDGELVAKSYTLATYSAEYGVSQTTARKRLNELVEAGKATIAYNVVIGGRERKFTGSRPKQVPVRGNLWTVL